MGGINPFTHIDSFENDAEIQIFIDHTEVPALRIPFWSDGAYDKDFRERVLLTAEQMAGAYAHAEEFSITVRVIINHRVVNF
jgi:hypothetical protein